MEPTTKSSSVNYGLYLGAILSIWTILNYGTGNLELIMNFWIIFLITPVLIISFGIISTSKAKAIQEGYKQAANTIFDANITTMITALILYGIGYGPVRGFAITLALGLITSVFTGVYVSKVLSQTLYLKLAKKAGVNAHA